MRIFLIGFMGSGKSYTGKRLAALLGYAFYDLDALIEEREECAVSDIFHDKGEVYFRELESRILRETASLTNAVISCGGGTPCFHENMEWMNANGCTVWLDPPLQLLHRRLQRKPHKRPLLSGLETEEQWLEFLKGKLAGRRPFYSRAQVVYRQESEEEDAADRLLGLLLTAGL